MSTYVRMHVRTNIRTYICMHIRTYVRILYIVFVVYVFDNSHYQVQMNVYMHVRTYVCFVSSSLKMLLWLRTPVCTTVPYFSVFISMCAVNVLILKFRIQCTYKSTYVRILCM